MDEIGQEIYTVIPEFNTAERLCNYHTGGEGETAFVPAEEWKRFNEQAGRRHEIIDGVITYNETLEPCEPDAKGQTDPFEDIRRALEIILGGLDNEL